MGGGGQWWLPHGATGSTQHIVAAQEAMSLSLLCKCQENRDKKVRGLLKAEYQPPGGGGQESGRGAAGWRMDPWRWSTGSRGTEGRSVG